MREHHVASIRHTWRSRAHRRERETKACSVAGWVWAANMLLPLFYVLGPCGHSAKWMVTANFLGRPREVRCAPPQRPRSVEFSRRDRVRR